MKETESGRIGYEDGDVPGVDRPWQYGDVYYWGDIAMRVTDPEMMNLPQIAPPPTAFCGWSDED